MELSRVTPQHFWFLSVAAVSLLVPTLGYWISGFFILTLGLQHGALDFAHLRRTGIHPARYFAAYAVLVFSFIGIYLLSPGASLAIFLFVSAFHFGSDHLLSVKSNDTQLARILIATLWGSAVLCICIVAHGERAVPVLNAYLAIDLPIVIKAGLWRNIDISRGEILIASAAVIVLAAARYHQGRRRAVAIVESILLCFFLFELPLFVGFALFFSLWHARDSLDAQKQSLQIGSRETFWQSLPLSVGSALLIAVTWSVSRAWIANPLDQAWFWVGVGALAFAHILLSTRLQAASAKPSCSERALAIQCRMSPK